MTKNQVKNTMKLSCNKIWKARIQETSKGKFFTEIKKDISFEPYLSSALTRGERILIIKLRTSDQNLEIGKADATDQSFQGKTEFVEFVTTTKLKRKYISSSNAPRMNPKN